MRAKKGITLIFAIKMTKHEGLSFILVAFFLYLSFVKKPLSFKIFSKKKKKKMRICKTSYGCTYHSCLS